MIAKTFAPFRGVKPFAIMEWGAASSCASSCHAVDRPSRVRAADLPAERPEKPDAQKPDAEGSDAEGPDAARPAGRGHAGWTQIACVRGTIPGPRFVTSDQAPNVRSGLRSAERTETRRRL